MIEVFTPGQMKLIDDFAVNELGIPSLQLMESAGKGIIREIEKISSLKKKKLVLFCGKGNNGGDGFVAARLADLKGAEVHVVLCATPSALKGNALHNYTLLDLSRIAVVTADEFLRKEHAPYDFIIDAIFGTSFHGSAEGVYFKAIRWMNSQKKSKIISVDIPSGLNGETGEVETDAVKADRTVTFSNPKRGFFQGTAQEYTGGLSIVDIGIPVERIRERSDIFLGEEIDFRMMMPARRSNSHKHSVGKVLIIAGSKGMTGAALMSSMAAMRSGAGQVILGIPDSEYNVVAKRTLEVMPLGLPSTSEGTFSYTAATEIQKRIEWSDVVVVGCGVSRQSETTGLIIQTIQSCTRPIVIDADGLNALAGDISVLEKRKSRSVILTPHHGEFSRLIGVPTSDIEKDKFELARRFATRYSVTLVLKGAPTIVAASNGNIFINPSGNPGMSTAGTGDVLSGMIGSLTGQGLSAESAAILGVYLHGAAGDRAAHRMGIHGMIARDIIKEIPHCMKRMSI